MIALTWLACSGGSITTTALPDARVGEVYTAAIEGDKRRRWRYAAEGLPGGLTINPSSGIVSGVPAVRGDSAITVQLESRGGDVRVEQALTLSVKGPKGACGRTFSGLFEGELPFSFDWGQTDAWTTLTLPRPEDDVEEVSFDFDDRVTVYAVRPGHELQVGEPLGPQADRIEFVRDGFRLGWDTSPNLGAHQAVSGDLTLLVRALSVGGWTLQTSCARAPVLEEPGAGPYRLGDRVVGSFRATKYDEQITVEAIDPLPAGLTLSEGGGLRGEALEPGLHDFRIRLSRETGGETVAAVAVGIYEPLEPACGETFTVPETTGTDREEWAGLPDRIKVDAFRVIEVPWAGHTGLAFDVGDLEFDPIRIDLPFISRRLVAPDASVFDPFVGDLGPFEIEATPQSWPPASYWQRFPTLRLAIASGAPLRGEVTLTCDDGPRPAETMLPVLDEGTLTATLRSTGGTPPVAWSAAGLPPGVELAADGTLTRTGDPFGSADVEITLEDAAGLVTTTPLTLWESTAACDEIVPCGQTITIPWPGSDDPIVCLPPADVLASDWAGFVVAHDGDGRPGLLRPGSFDRDDLEVRYFGNQIFIVAVRGTRALTGSLERYDQRPFAMVARDGADWEICGVCGDGPRPPNDELSCD